MNLSYDLRHEIAEELLVELRGRYDGMKRNIIADCPACGKKNKFGVYVGNDTASKRFGMCNCFSCQYGFRTLNKTLDALGRNDLIPKDTEELDEELSVNELSLFDDDELDDELVEIKMPKGYKRCFKNRYLKSRGFNADDFEYFPCGTNRGIDRAYADYVLLEIRDNGRLVGFVGRSTMDKEDIERHNERHRYKILRYKNSTENEFSKLIYNYDSIMQGETATVIICEGAFDAIALNRKLELYDNKSIVPIATFGKKISEIQMFKLQEKGVEQVVLGYDNDAKETTAHVADQLDKYFDVLIADIPDGIGKDWDEMEYEDIYDVFANNLKTIVEFNLSY